MGSVQDFIECPNCRSEAHSDFYYKTGEEYVNCPNCGYHYSATIINRDKLLNELTDADWEIKELKDPFCAYRIKEYNSLGYACGALSTEQEFLTLKEEIESLKDTIEFFAISRYVGGNIEATTVIDNGPKTDSAGFTEQDR